MFNSIGNGPIKGPNRMQRFMPSTICFVLSNHFCAYKLTALESFIIRCIGDFYLFIYLFIFSRLRLGNQMMTDYTLSNSHVQKFINKSFLFLLREKTNIRHFSVGLISTLTWLILRARRPFFFSHHTFGL